jgi:hypothetical protein
VIELRVRDRSWGTRVRVFAKSERTKNDVYTRLNERWNLNI